MRWPMVWSRRSGGAGLRLHRRPRGEAGFTVLRAADIPSVLLEIGFMSDGDLENILDPDWRRGMQEALVRHPRLVRG
jgi:N-acetylmuramoyl-L-alanine amidase